MATNIIYEPGWKLSVACTDPATPSSGDPVRYGERTGLALTDESDGGNDSGNTTVNFGPFVADLSVKGVDGSGNSAVAVGDMIFYVDADTPKLSKKASGYFFGFAMETVSSGSTATIQVAHPDAGVGVEVALHGPALGEGHLRIERVGQAVDDAALHKGVCRRILSGTLQSTFLRRDTSWFPPVFPGGVQAHIHHRFDPIAVDARSRPRVPAVRSV